MGNKYGHCKLVVWGNIDTLEDLVYEKILPKIPRSKYWLINQIERSLDSIGANFVEGYYSNSIPQYLKFLGYSRRSLAELKDHVSRSYKKRIIKEDVLLDFDNLCNKTLYLFSRLVNSLRKKI